MSGDALYANFDEALAWGLLTGQVLRCAWGEARHAGPRPGVGPWVVRDRGGGARAFGTPLGAARAWRHLLQVQVMIASYGGDDPPREGA